MSPETTTTHTFCRICESLCGLEVDLDDTGAIVAVRPDEAHVETDGFACVKGLKQHRHYASPDRLRHPMKRVGDRFERISWEQALAEIGAKVRSLRGDHGADSVGMYVGTAAGFSLLHPIFAQGFMTGDRHEQHVQPRPPRTAPTSSPWPRSIYGFPFSQPFPDLDRTWSAWWSSGANPIVSKWSFLQVPNPFQHLQVSSRQAAAPGCSSSTRGAPRRPRPPGSHVFDPAGTPTSSSS